MTGMGSTAGGRLALKAGFPPEGIGSREMAWGGKLEKRSSWAWAGAGRLLPRNLQLED